jgi:isopenicillin N synthase-like dioxygenase
MEKHLSIRELEKVGRAYIPYPADIRSVVENAVASWERFCRLDEAVRMQFPYDRTMNMGVGYELKKIKEAGRDLKEDFHITLSSKKWLSDVAWAIKDPVMLQFVDSASVLVDAVRPLILRFANELEKEFALPELARDVEEGKESLWFIRFLHYFGGSAVGDEIAAPHADKSGFTLHLYESDPGLQYLNFQKNWIDMPVSTGESVAIPGMRLQYRSENRLRATYHRVIATEKTARNGRFSVVCFVHPKNTPEYNKVKAGRLQEFPPGFNYDMPFDEFKELFI